MAPLPGSRVRPLTRLSRVRNRRSAARARRGRTRGRNRRRRFYFKRWLRTLPPYYAMLILFYLAQWAVAGIGIWQYLAHFLFLQMYLNTNWYMVSWSLCVEEHFYLLLPLIVWAIGRRARLRNLAAIVVVAEAIALYCRWRTLPLLPNEPELTHMRTHGLFIGLFLAFLAQERQALWKRMGSRAWLLGAIGIVASLSVMASVSYFARPGEPPLWLWVICPTLGTWTLALAFLPCVHDDSAWSRVSFP
jgi:peptidoglycan/LPS O-acetylase OafA/YrhL